MPLRLRVTGSQRGKLGDGWVKEFAACGGTIGRAPDNDWVLPDERRYVSGRHALIDYQAGAYYLVDTSRNGVFVNDADTAVGRGHPQRLFDGDRLRFGEYEIAISIVGGDENIPDDGMRDSVVRAQLVPVDESAEMKLVDESKLRGFDMDALQRHLAPGDHAAARGTAAARGNRSVPAATAGSGTARARGNTVEAFFAAAGLRPADLAGVKPEEMMQTAGHLLRELLTGLADLLQARTRMKDALRLPHTIIRPAQNNPLKFSPNVGEALKYLLGQRAETYLPPQEAVRSAFLDVKNHQQALFKAMVHALRDFTERFDPEELRSRFDRGLKRSPLLATANRFKYWELYEESYGALTQHEEGSPLPQLVTEELTRAYEQELEMLKQAHHRAASPAQPAASR